MWSSFFYCHIFIKILVGLTLSKVIFYSILLIRKSLVAQKSTQLNTQRWVLIAQSYILGVWLYLSILCVIRSNACLLSIDNAQEYPTITTEGVPKGDNVSPMSFYGLADILSQKMFRLVMNDPKISSTFLRFCRAQFCGENMEFLIEVKICLLKFI